MSRKEYRQTEEYAKWLNSLSIEEQAKEWVSYTQEDIEILQQAPNIDKTRAIRGIVLGNICGDSVNGLMGAKWLCWAGVDDEREAEMVKDGMKLTWLEATIAINQFGHFLPEACKKAFEAVFSTFQPLIDLLLTSDKFDDKNVALLVDTIYQLFHNIYDNPPGMHTSDIRYGLDCLWSQ